MNREELESVLAPYGLKLRGVVGLTQDEIRDYGFAGFQSVALVGNIGSSFWPEFTQSNEYLDGEVNPLDRWSMRVADELAPALNARPIYPFQGPPYLPFQQWAKRAEALHQSPIGLMMHPRYGLWHAYRFGLLFVEEFDTSLVKQDSPCLSCVEQPCLNTCPVGAFLSEGYDVPSCTDYLKQNPSAECFQHGCMARYMCPVGREFRYDDEQSQFHLRAFLKPPFPN